MSKTKRNIDKATLDKIFLRHSLGEVETFADLKGGMFNSVLKVTTKDGESYAVKIAPANDIQVLTYEKNLIKSEVYFYEKFAQVKNVHFPKVYGYDCDENSDCRYIIMEFVEGTMLSSAKLNKDENNQVMFSLGKAMAEMHNIACDEGFGYIQNGLRPTWDEAYFSMAENVIKNAETKKAKIPCLSEIRKIFDESKDLLKTVQTPHYLHFDLWAGNIMLKDKKLYSLIDCERAMLGDVMGDFISLDYTGAFDLEKNRHLIDGYNSVAKERLNFDSNQLKRFYLMKIYLGLIVFTEQHYRYGKFSVVRMAGKKYGETVIRNAIRNYKSIK